MRGGKIYFIGRDETHDQNNKKACVEVLSEV